MEFKGTKRELLEQRNKAFELLETMMSECVGGEPIGAWTCKEAKELIKKINNNNLKLPNCSKWLNEMPTLYQNNKVEITSEKVDELETIINVNGRNFIWISTEQLSDFKKDLSKVLNDYRI